MMEVATIAALLSPFLGRAALGDLQLSQLALYLDLLLRWNARMNLTAVRDPAQIITRHFGESLFAARHIYPADWKPETGNWKLLDIGSGAGFPGLPIKIWAPPLPVTLLESNQRKATFLREVGRALQLTQLEVFAARAEAYAPKIINRQSPIANVTVTLRAVERFAIILPACVRLLRAFPAGSRRLALLIGEPQLETAKRIAGALAWSDPLPIPQSSRRVLLVGEVRNTKPAEIFS